MTNETSRERIATLKQQLAAEIARQSQLRVDYKSIADDLTQRDVQRTRERATLLQELADSKTRIAEYKEALMRELGLAPSPNPFQLIAEELRQIPAIRVLKAMRESFAELAAQVSEATTAISKSFSPLRDALHRQMTESERQLVRILSRRGWVGLASYLNLNDLVRLLELEKHRKHKQIDMLVCKKFRRKRYRLLNQIVRKWWSVGYLSRRKPIVRAAIRAHKNRDYSLSIPALLPIVDGLSLQIVRGGSPPPKRTKAIYAKEAVEVYRTAEKDLWSHYAVEVVAGLMYKDYDFAKRPRSTMNRHAIIHGQVIGYGTEPNSLKVILLVDTFASILMPK